MLSQSTSSAINNHSGVKTCRMPETRARQLPQNMSPKSLRLSQGSKIILEIQINYLMRRKNLEKKCTKLRSSKKWWNFLKYQRRPTSNRRCISTIPWKASQILISKMESYKRCWLHHCTPRKLRWNPMQWSCRREVNAQFTQAKRKESLRSHSSEGLKAWGKPDALFSSEQGNLIRSSVFRIADPSNLRRSLLEGDKDHLLNQARSDLAEQELHVESLNKCIHELQRQTEEQRFALQDAQYGFVESRREQVRLQEELSMKEKVLRNTQIQNMHEMGEIKRAQEQRIHEVSVQKLRENHETIQQLTSQLQQMQEQMNSMNDSGEFQVVESNYSGRLSHVSSQLVMIRSSRALLSCDKRLPLDTRNRSGLQENVLWKPISYVWFTQRSVSKQRL